MKLLRSLMLAAAVFVGGASAGMTAELVSPPEPAEASANCAPGTHRHTYPRWGYRYHRSSYYYNSGAYLYQVWNKSARNSASNWSYYTTVNCGRNGR